MRHQKSLYAIPILFLATILFATNFNTSDLSEASTTDSSTMTIVSDDENFDKMMAVLMHKRCVNCHPSDNVPKQGEDSHPHYFGMSRGEGNLGYEATNCNTCHQHENDDFSGVPGAPEWSLAPQSMAWEGLTRVEIAQSMLDPARNGGRSHHEVLEHLTEHELVLWAWTPGIDAAGNPREAPPVPVGEYVEAVTAWFEAGAVIPAE
ncbi:MAG: hypothetical protein AAFZ63_16525 [Bacteroidota bacterium]